MDFKTTEASEDLGGHLGGVGDDQDEVALGGCRQLDDRALRVVGQELRDRSLDPATGLEREVSEALGAESARALGQLVDLTASHTGHPGRDDRLDPAASRKRRIEDTEARRRRPVGSALRQRMTNTKERA